MPLLAESLRKVRSYSKPGSPSDSQASGASRHSRIGIIAASSTLVILFVIGLNSPWFRYQLYVSTHHIPEEYAELYLLGSGEGRQFAVVNHSAHTRRFSYDVRGERAAKESVILAVGRFSLRAGGKRAISLTEELAKAKRTADISRIVVILNTGEKVSLRLG